MYTTSSINQLKLNGSSQYLICAVDNAHHENRKSSNGRKNREDGSEFDEIGTKEIAATQAVS